MIVVKDVLAPEAVSRIRTLIDGGSWASGAASAGPQAALAKRNEQLSPTDENGREASRLVLDALGRSPGFMTGALPRNVLPPMFSRYGVGDSYGAHVDNAIRSRPAGGKMRADLSGTLFLEGPDAYDGGELIIRGVFGSHEVKLPAGDLVLYPASTVHEVRPVVRGTRLASVFWVQSLVRDEADRQLLMEVDRTTQDLAAKLGKDDPAVLRLAAVYHNLLRRWAEV